MALVWQNVPGETCGSSGTAVAGRPCSYLGETGCSLFGIVIDFNGTAVYNKLICVDDGYTPPPKPTSSGKFMLGDIEMATDDYRNMNKTNIINQPIDDRIIGGWIDDKLLIEKPLIWNDDLRSSSYTSSRIELDGKEMIYVNRKHIVNPFGTNNNRISLGPGEYTAAEVMSKIPDGNLKSRDKSTSNYPKILVVSQGAGGGGGGGANYLSYGGSGGGGGGGISSSLFTIKSDHKFYVGRGGAGGAAGGGDGSNGGNTFVMENYEIIGEPSPDHPVHANAEGGYGGVIHSGGSGGGSIQSTSTSNYTIRYDLYGNGGRGGNYQTNGRRATITKNISSSKFYGYQLYTYNAGVVGGGNYDGGTRRDDDNGGQGGGGGASRFGSGGTGGFEPSSGSTGAGGGGASARTWASDRKPGGKGGDGVMYIYF